MNEGCALVLCQCYWDRLTGYCLRIVWRWSCSHEFLKSPCRVCVQYVDHQATSFRQYRYHYATIGASYIVSVCHGDLFYDHKAGAFT